jgi:hypothetical protein
MSNDSTSRFQFTLRRLFKWVAMFGVALGLLLGAGRLYRGWLYPYGPSHCCDIGLSFCLRDYADSHGGAYPAGEATPEASLSLLYPQLADANLLRGKTVPLALTQAALDKHGRLDPATCGWHYVEGLTTGDDPGLALFWDKIGLGHNGQRLSGGGHKVFFVNGESDYIPADRWQAFLDQQQKLHAAR